MTKPYQRAFPDFPAEHMPEIPAGFRDRSWRNEPCPCLISDASGIVIWVDYADPLLREYEGPRFRVQLCTVWLQGDGWQFDDNVAELFQSDDWGAVMEFLTTGGAA